MKIPISENTITHNILDSCTEINLRGNIQIHSVFLGQSEKVATGYYSILSQEEKNRAEKFKLDEVKFRWIVTRGLLRVLLANYIECDPGEIEFRNNKYGKPLVNSPLLDSRISFNLSHSSNVAVYVFTQNKYVGIDVEMINEIPNLKDVIDLCFHEEEKKWFSNVPLNKRNEIFYKIWTSKEAYIKAIGKGFSFSPDKICLDQDSNGGMSFKEIIGDQDFKKWKLLSFKPHSHFISSIVVDGDDLITEYYSINPQFIIDRDIPISEKINSPSAIRNPF